MVTNVAPRCSRGRRFTAVLSLIAAMAALPASAFAGSAAAPLGVSLTIAAGCGVSGTAPAGGQLAVSVKCDNTVPYRVETYRAVVVDNGSNGVNLIVVY